MFQRGHLRASQSHAGKKEGREGPLVPALAWRAARAALARGREDTATEELAAAPGQSRLHAGWWALHGRMQRHAGAPASAEAAFDLGLAAHPYLEDAACEGYFSTPTADGGIVAPERMPQDEARRALCERAGRLPAE